MQFPFSYWTQTSYTLSISGLLAVYNFNDSSQLGLDLQNSINLTPHGSIFATQSGLYGSGVEVPNGFTNNYLGVTDDRLILSGDRTYTLWVKPLGEIFNQNNLLWKGGTLEYYIYISAGLSPGQLNFGINTIFGLYGVNTSTGYSPSGVTPVATFVNVGQWNLVVAWYEKATSGAYIQVNNGIVYKSLPIPTTLTGNSTFGVGNYFDGIAQTDDYYLDDVAIWNRVLTAPERAAIWNNGNGKPYPYV